MKKEMLINVLQPEECRIAIIEDGILEELYVERTSHESYIGNIYKGKVVNLEPAIQAAFVDFSVGRNGFLHVSDVEPQYYRRAESGEMTAASPPASPSRERAEREPRRDRDRDRGDEPRRSRPAASSFEDRDPLPPPPAYPEDRPSVRERGERPEREPRRERGDRDRDRGDRSERGRKDRSEPRRFGEGLVGEDDWFTAPPPPPPPPPAPPRREPERFEYDEPRRRSEAPPTWAADPEPTPPPPPLPPSSPASRFGRGIADPIEAELPPSRTQRPARPTPPPPPAPASFRDVEDEPAPPPPPAYTGRPSRATPPPPPRVEPDDEPEAEPAAPSRERAEREPRRRRGRTGRPVPPPPPEPEPEFDADLDAEIETRYDEPLYTEPKARSAGGFGDGLDEPEAEELPPAPRRRGGRDAIRSRGGDRPRPAQRPEPAAEPERVREPERTRERERPAPAASSEVERPRERTRERERDRDREREREPERRRPAAQAPEPEAPAPRERERGRPTDRAGEEGYVPRRQRSRGEPTEPEPIGWAEIDELTADLESDDDGADDLAADTSSEAARAEGRRRRRRRGRRRDRETASPAGEAVADFGDDLDADLDAPAPAPAPARSGAAGRDRDRGRGRGRDRDRAPEADFDDLDADLDLDLDTDSDLDLDDDDALVSSADEFDPEDQIDPELEEEIRKEIEEITELEREMGLRGTVEARPRRGDDRGESGAGGKFVRGGRGQVKPPIQEIFRRGDEVLVQVIKESIGTKGPTLSTYISIPGRYLVLMPGLNRVGVSRKIADEGQRRKLRQIMNELNPPKGLGFIVRTAGLERSKRELARDLAYLLRLWKVILKRIKKAKGPTPIYQESDMITRTIRDIFTGEIDTIWIDEPAAFERAQEFLRVVMPRFVNRLKLYEEKVPLFHKYGIEDEIAKIQRRTVPLPEGGSIVIDQTEALVAIDVNSGNFRVENDAERTAYEMNLRAAKEIARQLRLRDLGGVIVNDFIDMRDERNRRGVERALRDAIKRDRARTKVLRMSQFGLIEMTRQRIRPSLKRSVYEDCAHCSGAGVVKTVESMSIEVMRLISLSSHREEIRRVNISVSSGVANYLNNRKRRELARLEAEANMTIHIRSEDTAPPEHLQIDCFDANNSEIRLIPQVATPHPRRGR